MTGMFKGEPSEDHDAALPPYEGRKEAAEIGTPDQVVQDGADVGGARRPTESDRGPIDPAPADTPGGSTTTPADEQPAAASGGDQPSEGATGPAHIPGTGRAEDKA